MAPRLDKLSPRAGSAYQQFLQQYPQIPVTSAYRDPTYNAKVGGAKGSAHMHGDALDFSMRGLDEAQKAEVVDWWRGQGATGIGFYPNSDSIHVDMREGPNRAWGPNYSHTSLDQTPEWFRSIASEHRGAPAPSGSTFSGQGGSDMAYGSAGNDDLMGAPQQQGGLGGLGGFFNKPETRDLMQAIGLSMMSSPRNNWLQDTGRYLPGIQDRREKREETAADREATEAALRSAGFTAEEAKAYSRNPQAANLALDAKALQRDEAEKVRTFQANNAYRDSLVGGTQPMAGGYDAPAAEPTRAAQAGPGPALLQPGSLTDAMPEQIPATQAPAPQAAAQPNRTLQFRDQLYAENDRLYQQAVRAENPQQRQAAELAIKANEAKIGRINDLVGEPPKIVERYDENGQPQKMVWDQNAGEYVPFGGSKVPSNGVTIGPDGSVQIGGPARPLTEAQSKDTVYSARAEGALPILDKYENTLTSRTDAAMGAVPYGLGREFQNEEFQLAQQAGDEFLQAILRKDTGAAITEQEQVLYGKTYLPAPGDSEALIKQKRQARRRALEAIKVGLPPSAIVAQELALRKSGSPTLGEAAGGGAPQPRGGGANRTTNGLSWSVN